MEQNAYEKVKERWRMKIEIGKQYIVKQGWLGNNPFAVKVVKIGVFRVYCRWFTHDLDYDYSYQDFGWISKRRFICEEKDW